MSSLRKYVKAPPWYVFEPDRVMALTTPPATRPYSALKFAVCTWTSAIESSWGVMFCVPAESELLSTPSICQRLERARAPRKAAPSLVFVVPGTRIRKDRKSREIVGSRSSWSRCNVPPVCDVVVSTIGTSARTVTCSAMPPGCNVKSMAASAPTVSFTPVRFATENPDNSAVSSYSPGGSAKSL